jgi:ABC-type bacteriocin/lantibiotic exporter with double-glycine peptidase domain
MVISLAVGSFFVVNGQILVGGLISLFLASDRLTSPIISIVNITNQLNSVSPLLKNKALQKPISKQFNNLSFVNLPDQQRIVFDNCTLGYENLAILKNINFKIFEGDKILITGKSGIGKSTLFKSLLNELPLIKGKILVDNQLNKSNFLSNFGIVGQDTYIFAESLRFNLTLGKNIPSSQLIKVLKKVKLEYLANKKHLDTPIGEKGLSLSGGEKRKVEIARALLNKKEFLLVDEGLSGLDDDSRKQVFSLLQSLPQTIIEIEHTMSIEDKQKFNQVVNLVAK